MAFAKSYAFFVLILFPCSLHAVHALNYARFSSGDGNFTLHWTYSNNKLIFNMTCKAIGWCAVGFTENNGGGGMINYDIAAGGVAANTSYLEDYWSNTTSAPPKDAVNNFELVKAMEMGEYTSVKFERNLTTGESGRDVQFTNNTEVYIVWAMHSTMDANSSSANLGPQHTSRGISANKQNLIAEAMAAAMTPTTTTMMMPSTSVVSTPQPTGITSTTSTMLTPQSTGITPTTSTMVVPSSSTVSTPQSTATTVSFGDKFMLTWIYSNNKLFFTLRCKTTGWCAVAFTTGDGSGMKDYDIALGGVASGNDYLDDYWSTSTTKPSKDSANNFVRKTVTETGGYTTVQFERDPETSDTVNDVQFKPGTEVMIAFAMHDSMDGNIDISKHTDTGVLPTKYKLVPGAANMLESRVMLSVILAAIVVYLMS